MSNLNIFKQSCTVTADIKVALKGFNKAEDSADQSPLLQSVFVKIFLLKPTVLSAQEI